MVVSQVKVNIAIPSEMLYNGDTIYIISKQELSMMVERTVAVSIPPDLYAELENVPLYQGKLKEKIQLSLAIGMFVSREVSLTRAAEYAGMKLMDFIDLLNKLGLPTVDYTEDMLTDDLAFAESLSS